MADLKAIRLSTSYAELRKAVENQNYAKVVRSCNKILNESDFEVKAWQCKLTALIHLGNFKEGLQALKKCKFLEQLIFEKAYCEYRLNQTSEAWNTLSECGDNSQMRIKELQAQVLYRLERYEECYDIYRELVKGTSDPFDQERLTNLGAVAVNRALAGTGDLCPVPNSDSSYEHLYNYGCDQIASGHVSQALRTLQDAETLCRKMLVQQDGATEEEVLEEVAIIRAQQGYCLQYLGREKEALALYNSILKMKPDDVALLAFINNNIVAINREANVFDSKKRMKATGVPELEYKLTTRQKGAIALNHCLMAFLTHQDDVCQTEVNKLSTNYPYYSLEATIVQAALLGRLNKLTELAKLIKGYIHKQPETALHVTLAAAQILLSQNERETTLEMLLALEDNHKFRGGIASAIVQLCCQLNRQKEAAEILGKALECHKSNNTEPSSLCELWQHAANFYLRFGEPKSAVASLEALREVMPKDINVLAQLIQAYAEVDKEKAQELSKQLPSAVSLLKKIDIAGLESSFSLKYTKKIKVLDGNKENISPTTVEGISSPQVEIVAPRKKKAKKRKIRLPKDMIEGVEPDPERWIPRWQRKGYKTKRNRRNREIGTGTQGMGISGEAMDKYDITKTSHSRPSHHVSSPQTDTGAKRQQWKKPASKKKKK